MALSLAAQASEFFAKPRHFRFGRQAGCRFRLASFRLGAVGFGFRAVGCRFGAAGASFVPGTLFGRQQPLTIVQADKHQPSRIVTQPQAELLADQ